MKRPTEIILDEIEREMVDGRDSLVAAVDHVLGAFAAIRAQQVELIRCTMIVSMAEAFEKQMLSAGSPVLAGLTPDRLRRLRVGAQAELDQAKAEMLGRKELPGDGSLPQS